MSIKRFIFAAIFFITAYPAFAVQSMTCISENNAFVRCGLPDADKRYVTLGQVVSGHCFNSGSWGTDSAGIWVAQGCGANFHYHGGYRYNQPIEPYVYGYAYGPDQFYPANDVFVGQRYYYNGGYHGTGRYQR